MSVYELIASTLEKTGVDVFFNKYNASSNKKMPEQYIVYFEMIEQGELYADDKETQIEHHFQVNVFSRTNYNALVKLINEKMTEAGFTRRFGRDLPYDKKTQYYNRVQRYYYNEEVN